MSRRGCAIGFLCLLVALAAARFPAAHAVATMQHEQEPAVYEMLSPGQSQATGLPAASNAYVLPARTQEVAGLSGVKRFLIGTLLMAAAVMHFSRVTYKKIMPARERAFQQLAQAGARIMGEEETSRLQYTLER